jgi:hypothetical protein
MRSKNFRIERNLRKICEAFPVPVTAEHIAVMALCQTIYALTGKHETASIHDFRMEYLIEDAFDLGIL